MYCFYDIDDANYEHIPEYNVFFYDFNKQKLITTNIFSESSVKEIIEDLKRKLGEDNCTFYFNDIKEIILNWAQYHYWCRREYELFIGDAFEENIDKYEKVDIFAQIKMNIDLITENFLDKVFSDYYLGKEESIDKKKNQGLLDNSNVELKTENEKLRAENTKLKYSEIPRLEGYIEGLKYFIEDSREE